MHVKRLRLTRKTRFGKAIVMSAVGLLGFAGPNYGQEQDIGPTFTFEQAVALSVKSSADSAAAQADFEGAVAHRRQTAADFGPKVDANFTMETFDRPLNAAFGPEEIAIRPEQLRQGRITIKQPLFGLYDAYRRTQLAQSQTKSRGIELEIARTNASFSVADLYIAAQQAQEMVRVAKTSLAGAESQYHDAEALVKAGKLTQSELLKFSIASYSAQAELAVRLAKQEKSQKQLLYATGLPFDKKLKLEPLTITPSIEKFDPLTLVPKWDEVIKGHQSVKFATSKLEVAEQESAVARWKFAPSVDAFARWERVYSEAPMGTPPFTRTYGIMATWEIWDNGSRAFALQEIAAKRTKATTLLNDVKQRVRLAIDALVSDITAAKARILTTKTSITQADEAHRLDKARFASGLATATDLLLSETTKTKAQGEYVAAITEMHRLVLQLEQAVGLMEPKLLL